MHRVDDAWSVISEHKDKIDFNIICGANEDIPSPYFQIKRDAQDVYKYMHDTNVIDDASYAYFQVIGGRLSDKEFWNNYFANKTTSERLQLIHDAYNFNNPFELGLVVLDDEESKNLIFDVLKNNEDLDDFIIGNNPGVFFDSDTLIYLMETHHLDYVNYPKYFSIILQMIAKDVEADPKYEGSTDVDVLSKDGRFNVLWKSAYEIMDSRIREICVDNTLTMSSFINSDTCRIICENTIHDERLNNIICTLLINSIEFMNYPYKYLSMLYKATGYDLNYKNAIDASTCIMEKNYSYLLSYTMLDVVNCDRFIIKYPFPAGMNCIYDKYDNMIFINGEVKPFDESDIDEFEFAFEYEATGEVPESAINKVDCTDPIEAQITAEELCIATLNFYHKIQDFLG